VKSNVPISLYSSKRQTGMTTGNTPGLPACEDDIGMAGKNSNWYDQQTCTFSDLPSMYI
jgi:hypothetical protein